jgi:hypothetical protein
MRLNLAFWLSQDAKFSRIQSFLPLRGKNVDQVDYLED